MVSCVKSYWKITLGKQLPGIFVAFKEPPSPARPAGTQAVPRRGMAPARNDAAWALQDTHEFATESSSLLQTPRRKRHWSAASLGEFLSEGTDAFYFSTHLPSKMIWHAQKAEYGRWWLMALFTLFGYVITGKEITFVEIRICHKNKQPKIQGKQNSLHVLTFQM